MSFPDDYNYLEDKTFLLAAKGKAYLDTNEGVRVVRGVDIVQLSALPDIGDKNPEILGEWNYFLITYLQVCMKKDSYVCSL